MEKHPGQDLDEERKKNTAKNKSFLVMGRLISIYQKLNFLEDQFYECHKGTTFDRASKHPAYICTISLLLDYWLLTASVTVNMKN